MLGCSLNVSRRSYRMQTGRRCGREAHKGRYGIPSGSEPRPFRKVAARKRRAGTRLPARFTSLLTEGTGEATIGVTGPSNHAFRAGSMRGGSGLAWRRLSSSRPSRPVGRGVGWFGGPLPGPSSWPRLQCGIVGRAEQLRVV